MFSLLKDMWSEYSNNSTVKVNYPKRRLEFNVAGFERDDLDLKYDEPSGYLTLKCKNDSQGKRTYMTLIPDRVKEKDLKTEYKAGILHVYYGRDKPKPKKIPIK